MSCRKVKKSLARYVDGDLGGKWGDKVREHLDGCPECRALAGKLEVSSAALSSLRPLKLSDAASRRILGAVQAAGAPRKTLLPGWLRSPTALAVAGAGAALILACVVVVGVVFVADSGPGTETTAPSGTEEKALDSGATDLVGTEAEEIGAPRNITVESHGTPPTPVVKATSTNYTEQSLREMFENLETRKTFGQRYTMGNAISLASSFIDNATTQYEGLGQDPAMLESMISFITIGEPALLTCYVEKALFQGLDVTIIGFCAPPRSGTTTYLTRIEAWVMDPVRFVADANTSIVHFLEMK